MKNNTTMLGMGQIGLSLGKIFGITPVSVKKHIGRNIADGILENVIIAGLPSRHALVDGDFRGAMKIISKWLSEQVQESRANRVLLFSSIDVYGAVKGRIDEQTQISPIDDYGVSQYENEETFTKISSSFKYFQICRLTGVYSSLAGCINPISIMMNSARRNDVIPVFNGGLVYRDYLSIHNLSRMIMNLLNGGESRSPINLATYESMRLMDYAKIIKYITGAEIKNAKTCDVRAFDVVVKRPRNIDALSGIFQSHQDSISETFILKPEVKYFRNS